MLILKPCDVNFVQECQKYQICLFRKNSIESIDLGICDVVNHFKIHIFFKFIKLNETKVGSREYYENN